MAPGQDVCAVIINFRTPELTLRAARSLRSCYSTLPLLIIDNGSHDNSEAMLLALAGGSTELLLNARNIHHGPAMDQALRHLTSAFVLFLDSDIEVLRAGFVERMQAALLERPHAYAVGKKIWMNRRGFDVAERAGGEPYIRPICMLLNRSMYLTLPPFERHGAPCLANMREASLLTVAVWFVFPPENDARTNFTRQYAGEIIGSVNIVLMAFALFLATRPKWAEPYFGGLDKMYITHRRVATTAFLLIFVHVLTMPISSQGAQQLSGGHCIHRDCFHCANQSLTAHHLFKQTHRRHL